MHVQPARLRGSPETSPSVAVLAARSRYHLARSTHQGSKGSACPLPSARAPGQSGQSSPSSNLTTVSTSGHDDPSIRAATAMRLTPVAHSTARRLKPRPAIRSAAVRAMCWTTRAAPSAVTPSGQRFGSSVNSLGVALRAVPPRNSDSPVNLIGNVVARLRRAGGLPRLEARRLRATWLVELMRARIPHEVIARAAGLATTEQLARYLRWVPPVTEETALRMLRGTPWK